MKNIYLLYKDEEGFTLVELMITMAMAVFLSAAVYFVYEIQQRSTIIQQDVASMQQDLRAAGQSLAKDIRMAAFNPQDYEGKFGFVLGETFKNQSGTATNVTTNSQQIAFTSDLNENGKIDIDSTDIDVNGIDVNDNEQIAYRLLNDQLQKFSTSTGAITWQTVAENIEGIEFWYQLSNGTRTLNPTITPLNDIDQVIISLLARGERTDKNFQNNVGYRTASGAIFPHPVDGRQRRLLILTIQCRNA